MINIVIYIQNIKYVQFFWWKVVIHFLEGFIVSLVCATSCREPTASLPRTPRRPFSHRCGHHHGARRPGRSGQVPLVEGFILQKPRLCVGGAKSRIVLMVSSFLFFLLSSFFVVSALISWFQNSFLNCIHKRNSMNPFSS